MTGIPFFTDYESELRSEHGTAGNRLVTVSGLTGVGTGTLAAFLADEFGLEHIDAGQFFREKAEEYGLPIDELDARQEELEAEHGVDLDTAWDRTALRYAFEKDDVLLEGRLTGVLLQDIAPVRVWVECDAETVAQRIADRDNPAEDLQGKDVDDLVTYVETRNQEQLQRYRDKYGIDPTDKQYYNVVIDNSRALDTVKQELRAEVSDLL
ncbi:MAG: cytidylate kinase family protein [Candidatus Nanohaloarchaea archaeon]|nr:cytidylate kinase family protein [Candidatus Nanohaloarchaea archaeon]